MVFNNCCIIFYGFLTVLTKNLSEFVPGPDFSSPPAQKLTPPSPGSPRGRLGAR